MEADTEYENDIVCAYNAIGGTEVTIAAVIDQLQDIIVNAYDGTWFEEYKSKWVKRIHRVFEKNNIVPAKSRASWDIISAKVIAKLCNGDYDLQGSKKTAFAMPQVPTTASHSKTLHSTTVPAASSTSALEASSSATVAAASELNNESASSSPLTTADKANVVAKYDSMDVTKMWKLSTGTIVEERIRQRALNESREHLAHSFILDVHDKSWLEFFDERELTEIRNHKCTDLPLIPEEVEKYLGELRGLCPEDLYTKVSSEKLPLNSNTKWVQDTFAQAMRLIQSGFVPIGGSVTEGGLLKRVWGCVDSCFDFSTITCISGEKCSQSSADAMNKDRFSRLARQKTGRKMDFLFLHQTKELGCGECGLVGGVNTTKELCDAGFKMPKVMRDMLVKAVAMSPALKRDLLISGIYIGEMKLRMVLLDSPCGYVTRYDALNDVMYPENESELCRKLTAIVRTILGFRMLMENVASKLENDGTEIAIGRCQAEQMIPSFMPSSSSSNKKRKQEF